jgi:hypothetical protein
MLADCDAAAAPIFSKLRDIHLRATRKSTDAEASKRIIPKKKTVLARLASQSVNSPFCLDRRFVQAPKAASARPRACVARQVDGTS